MPYRLENLSNLPSTEIPNAFFSIPEETTSIDMSFNELGRLSKEFISGIIESIKMLSPRINTLNLGDNKFDEMVVEDAQNLLNAIPPNITSISLAYNGFSNKMPVAKARAIMSALHSGVTSLDLQSNNFDTFSPNEFGMIMNSLQTSELDTINFSNNQFYQKNTEELVAIFKQLPRVSTLILRANDLFEDHGPVLKYEAEFEPGVTSVESETMGDVRDNDGVLIGFYHKKAHHTKSASELKTILSAIPSSVSTLDLRRNGLNNKSLSELIKALDGLPLSVKQLDLRDNDLSEQIFSGLKKVFKERFNFLNQAQNVTVASSDITSKSSINMEVLSGFIAAMGVAAIAVAFVALNAATFGTAGVIVAAIGVTATLLGGIGLFKYAPEAEIDNSQPRQFFANDWSLDKISAT